MKKLSEVNEITRRFIDRTITVYNLPTTISQEDLALKVIDHAVCWLCYLEEELGTDEEEELMQNSSYKYFADRIEELHEYVA